MYIDNDAIVSVMRTQGSLRVVLNSKIWEGMMVERPSTKSIRITATEGDVVRVFLIMVSIIPSYTHGILVTVKDDPH